MAVAARFVVTGRGGGVGGGRVCPLLLPPGVIAGETGQVQGPDARRAPSHSVAVSVALATW